LIRFWAIADTHLSFGKARDMVRFSERWHNHTERLAVAWQTHIAPEDVVLLLGDISWAHSGKQATAERQEGLAAWQSRLLVG
jgi:predicted phosphohydrolase